MSQTSTRIPNSKIKKIGSNNTKKHAKSIIKNQGEYTYRGNSKGKIENIYNRNKNVESSKKFFSNKIMNSRKSNSNIKFCTSRKNHNTDERGSKPSLSYKNSSKIIKLLESKLKEIRKTHSRLNTKTNNNSKE